MLAATSAQAEQALYFKIELSYVFEEAHYYFAEELPKVGAVIYSVDHDVVAASDAPRVASVLELGIETSGGFIYGLRHLSTPAGGCPFDCGGFEYFKNEVFVGYKFGGL